MKSKLHFVAVANILFLMSDFASACLGGGVSSTWVASEAVKKATAAGVVVFERGKNTTKDSEINMKLVKYLFGDKSELLSSRGLLIQYFEDSPAETITNFGHAKVHFWLGSETNSKLNNSCNIFSNVVIGKKYLLLRTSPASKFILEPILDENDRWLDFIRHKDAATQPTPMDFYSFASQSQIISIHTCSDSSQVREVNSLCLRSNRRGKVLRMEFKDIDPFVFYSADKKCFDLSSVAKRVGIKFTALPSMKYCES